MSDEEVTFLTNGGDPNNDAVNMAMIHPKLRLLLVTTGPEGCRDNTQVKKIILKKKISNNLNIM